MKIRNKGIRGKRWSKVYRRRKVRRVENTVFDVKRDGTIGAACRRGWGIGIAKT